MQPSIYNYYISKNGVNLFFNGITERFFTVSDTNASQFKKIIETPDLYKDQYPSFIKKMQDEGFIVNDLNSDTASLKAKYSKLRKNDEFRLMLLPSYDCNLSCWYCTQHHKNTHMSKETIESVKRHIISSLSKGTFKYFHLSWFGGEPLLEAGIIIDIGGFAKKFCKENNIIFYSHITTNGTLLNKQLISELYDAGVRSYQITIDGNKRKHDQVKVLKSGSAYDAIMANIICIIRNHDDTHCILRYNYSSKNLDVDVILKELDDALPNDIRSRITVSMCKIWQENEDNVDLASVHNMAIKIKEMGMRISLNDCGMCYADQRNFECIFPNGGIGKCDNDNMNHCKARLSNDGSIEMTDDKPYSTQAFFTENNICNKCKYLPMCWGPCPREREVIAKKKMGNICSKNNPDSYFEKEIINTYITRA